MFSVPPAASRTGVELHPAQCRVAEVFLRRGGAASGDIRVKAFALLGEGRTSPVLSVELDRLRRDRQLTPDAWVTIWGLPSAGRKGSPTADLEAEIARQIQPLVDAGFHVRGVCTPAMALTAVARVHARATPGMTAAYVALENDGMCIAIVRDGVLLFSREISPELAGAAAAHADRLADELRRLLVFLRQSFRAAVEQIVLCGGMANLRSLTSSIGSALDLPVETLDSLSGIDAEAVPEPADTFRAMVAALWPAIAVAAEDDDQPNLLPVATQVSRVSRRHIAALAALAFAAVLAGTAWYFFARPARDERDSELARLQQQVARLEREVKRSDVPLQPRTAPVAPRPDLVVSSILYSQQRRLAIINGRIVSVGDRIESSTILYIEPRAVTVRFDDGTQQTFELNGR